MPFFLILHVAVILPYSNRYVMDMVCENHGSIPSLSPYSIHKIQLLDVGFMVPHKCCYWQNIEKQLRKKSGSNVRSNQVGELFRRTYHASMLTSINAFKRTELFPCNAHYFKDIYFMPSNNTQETLIINEFIDALNDVFSPGFVSFCWNFWSECFFP